MKRFLLKLLPALAVAGVLVWAVLESSGYVLIAWKNLRYESSLWVLVLLIGGLWLLWRCLRLALVSFGLINPWSRRNRGRRQYNAAEKGLLDLVEGRWARAEQRLEKAAEGATQPLMFYLGAARAASHQGRREACEALLERALQRQPRAELAVALTHAELLREQGDQDGALQTLQVMHERHPQHPLVLQRLVQALVDAGQWAQLPGLLPAVRKARMLADEALTALEIRVWSERLHSLGAQQRAAHSGDPQPLQQLWQQLPNALRQQPQLIHAYAGQLHLLGHDAEAVQLLHRALKKGYDSRLIGLYGQLGSDPAGRLQLAEEQLARHPDDPQLLLCLGRLCQHNGLPGKAREYLERSLDAGHSSEASLELARLLASQGELQRSNRLLQELCLLQEPAASPARLESPAGFPLP